MYQIFILESFKSHEQKVGYEIYKELQQNYPDVSFYLDIDDRSEFFTSIELIIREMVGKPVACFLHIDCHGNDDGIILKNGDRIRWEEMRIGFRKIYSTTAKALVLCMSSCEGFYGVKMVPHFEPCPYHCICGSFKKIGFEESRLGYQTFYNTLLKGDDISAAIDAVDNVTPNLEFVGFTAKRMFEMVTDGYINSLTVEKIESEKKKMLSLIKKNFRSDPLLIEFVHQAYSIEAQKKLFIETYSRIFLA